MDKNWLAFIIASVVVIVMLILACLGARIIGDITDTLQAPAVTSNITIRELVIITDTANITLRDLSTQVNSKLLDLIITAIH